MRGKRKRKTDSPIQPEDSLLDPVVELSRSSSSSNSTQEETVVYSESSPESRVGDTNESENAKEGRGGQLKRGSRTRKSQASDEERTAFEG